MMRVLQGLKLTFSISLIVGLVFSSALFVVLVYAKATGKQMGVLSPNDNDTVYAEPYRNKQTTAAATATAQQTEAMPQPSLHKTSAFINAPIIRQHPELPAGCEITSLTMLLQYYGVKKGKMDLLPEMKLDTTPVQWNKDRSIKYWGNPNNGFVGDIKRKAIGFGIYHGPLYELLRKYAPDAVDLTGSSFYRLEQQISQKIPVIVWTTIDFQKPTAWVTWNTPSGPVRTTFLEHAVLLVGYDQHYVYVNDPLSGRKNEKISKEQFIQTWELMGKQALSYVKNETRDR